jgi:hypothetical protein
VLEDETRLRAAEFQPQCALMHCASSTAIPISTVTLHTEAQVYQCYNAADVAKYLDLM